MAEAAKVIENSQRDINIAFVNELAKIFNILEIDTHEVLKAAETKSNFLPFKPGLVGGHCIGVDPYYLAQKAQAHGYHPEIILVGRRLNDTMGDYVASQVVKLMIKKSIVLQNASVLILGITFKENCPDIRNTKVIDMIRSFQDYGLNVSVYDPWADPAEVFDTYGISSSSNLPVAQYDAIVHAIAHTVFLQIDINDLKKTTAIIYDVKSVLPFTVDGRL